MAGKLKNIKVHKAVYSIWVLFVLYLLFSWRRNIAGGLLNQSGYIRLMELCIVLGILLEFYFIHKVSEKLSENGKRACLFGIAFAFRILSVFFSQYTPTNDFANYYHGACYFAEHGFAGGLYEPLDRYGIAEFAGWAVMNGCLLKVFSPTLLGMQVLNCIYTAGSCVLLYEIGKKITEKAAFAAAVLYTFYPVSILSSHITTNVHGAAFFMLASMLFFIRAQKSSSVKKRIGYAMLCAVTLVISNYYHPSAIMAVCAYVAYTAGCEISNALRDWRTYRTSAISDIRWFRGNIAFTAAVVVLYAVLTAGSMSLLRHSGFVRSPKVNIVLMKTVWAFNEESFGGYSQADVDYIFSFPQEERDAVCLRMIRERLKDPSKVLKLMLQKTKLTWFSGDLYFYFYLDGVDAKYNEQISRLKDEALVSQIQTQQAQAHSILYNINTVDDIFVYIMWILAVIGICFALLRFDNSHLVYFVLYIPLGWMLFIMISEMQSRYRYQGFMVIVLLAGYGLVSIKDWVAATYFQ